MHVIQTDSSLQTLRLFPRLAMENHEKPLIQNSRGLRSPRRTIPRMAPVPIDPKGNSAQSQMRNRLLKMILENERARRIGQRPNAS
jgi:hypothetical protein